MRDRRRAVAWCCAPRTGPACAAPTSPSCSSTPVPAFLASRVERKRPPAAARRRRVRRARSSPGCTRERAALYAEVADLTVDVEPFHATEEKPKRAMADRIAELVLAHEAQVSA